MPLHSRADLSPPLPPSPQLGSVSVLHLRVDDIHAIALLPRSSNANAMLGFSLLTRTVGAVRSYCGGECTEAALRANFVLVLELLDEVADYGVPQVTDPATLKAYIFQRGLLAGGLGGGSGGGGLGGFLGGGGSAAKRAAQAAAATLQVTGAVGWRAPGIKYKRNEVFLDVVETVDALVSARGATLRAEVVGRVMMKAFLSGMPDVKLGLNDRVEVRACACVRERREGRVETGESARRARRVLRSHHKTCPSTFFPPARVLITLPHPCCVHAPLPTTPHPTPHPGRHLPPLRQPGPLQCGARRRLRPPRRRV